MWNVDGGLHRLYYKEQNQLLQNRLRAIKNHIRHYYDLEEILGFQYYLDWAFSVQTRKQMVREDRAGFSAHLLFYRNLQSLQSALCDLECDLIHCSATNLRTVHEAIPKMYYISLYPDEIRRIIVHEKIHWKTHVNATKELCGRTCRNYLEGDNLQFATNGEFQEFKKKYSVSSFRKALYDESRKTKIQDLYNDLSISVHPNITRNEYSKQYSSELTEKFYGFLKNLSYFNVAAHLEGTYELMRKFGLIDLSENFLEKTRRKFKSADGYEYFVPNKKNLPRLKSLPT